MLHWKVLQMLTLQDSILERYQTLMESSSIIQLRYILKLGILLEVCFLWIQQTNVLSASLTGGILASELLRVEVYCNSSVAPPTRVTWYSPSGVELVEDGSHVLEITSNLFDRSSVSFSHSITFYPTVEQGTYQIKVETDYYNADIDDQSLDTHTSELL